MADFDDQRLIRAMRTYLAAVDALSTAIATGDDRGVIDAAEERAIAAMSLRRRLADLGWTGPRRSPPPEHGADGTHGAGGGAGGGAGSTDPGRAEDRSDRRGGNDAG